MVGSDALTKFGDWLDDRLGYRAAKALVARHLRPAGPRWSLALGMATLGMFLVVALTGAALMAGYSPAADHGWSSVYHIESTPGGSFVRGLHYFGSHALIILFAIHIARTILVASFRAPRDLAWIAAVLLLPMLAAAAVTGNPLSASNKALGQIEVEGHILGALPLVGPLIEGLLIGGNQVGHLTITRLYTLHVLMLPMLAGLLLLLHIYQLVRWAPHQSDKEPAESPRRDGLGQSARNALVFGVLFAVVALLAWRVGVPLGIPADPSIPSMPRPEWYFRALFALRNGMTGAGEFVTTGLLPMAFLLILILLPWIDRLLSAALSRWFRFTFVIGSAALWCGLTFQSYAHDRSDRDYQEFRAESEQLADRAKMLAAIGEGIPTEGPARLLQSDPKTQGPRLFRRHCANCHSYIDAEGNGIAATKPAASNLYRFASRDWIAGLLDPARITEGEYFGHTAFVQGFASMGMIDFVENQLYAVEEGQLDTRREQVRKIVLALSAEAHLPYQREQDSAAAEVIAAGRELIRGDEISCATCHKYGDTGELGLAPDLTGYGSRQWLREFIADPTAERFYTSSNDGMPSFRPVAGDSADNILSEKELLLLVDWLRADWPRREDGEG